MKQHSFARTLLLPLVPLYRLALKLREVRLGSRLEPVQRLRWPVVSIGNLSTGGAGKTPLTIALARAITRRGLHVDVLSRGYGRQSPLPARVDAEGTAAAFGDEPLLIAQATEVPVYVAAQRYLAGLTAEDGSADLPPGLHLLDDGFQHRQLFRDVDILMLNGRDLADRLLPAGNLREPLEAACRATVIAIPADETALEAKLKGRGWEGPIWRLRRRMDVPAIDGAAVAFCGIARPEQFFEGLEAGGLRLAARVAFADHHRYTAGDIERLLAKARGAGACAFITTEKDRVRMGKLGAAFPESLPLKTAGLRVEIEDESAAVDWLVDRIEGLNRAVES
jgi:tetraacyldisaccharide 4'-kinase